MKRFSRTAAPVLLGAAALVAGVVAHGSASVGGWLAEAAERAGFGAAVAVVGEDVLVGESSPAGAPGTVHVYRRAGDEWQEQATIRASEEAGDNFGAHIEADGSTVLIAAINPTNPMTTTSVFLYERDAAGAYVQRSRLMHEDSGAITFFGYAVALDGTTALVGAPLVGITEMNPQTAQGAVYVYDRGADGAWTRTATLTPSDARPGGIFGVSVALEGEHALVGSPASGIYAFRRAADGWREVGKVAIDGLLPADQFGAAMRIHDGVAYIAAPGRSEGAGAVFALRPSETGWTQVTEIAAPDTVTRAFGASIAADGSRIYIGAPGTAENVGAVYVFEAANDTWTRVGAVTPDEGTEGDQFGTVLDASAGKLAVGLVNADHGLGKASIFEAAGAAWTHVAAFTGEAVTFEAVTGGEVACTQGAAADFDCGSVDLVAFMPIAAIGGDRGVDVNDVWGWVDPETGKEYALVGRVDGTAFVDISDPTNPVYVGELPLTEGAQPNAWRDIKVYQDHAYIVADGAGQHGVQVVDLTRLRAYAGTTIPLEADTVYTGIASAHNIVINEESGFAYAVGVNSGGETCGGGLHMIDIREPKNPKFAGCFADTETGSQRTGYSHDAQCVMYHGPDSQYTGREICIGSNETAISIADVTDKESPKAIAHASYPNVGYTHQGWFTDDHRYFYVDDELDEMSGTVPRTRMLVWDLADLDDPQLIKEYLGETASSDHNLYIRGNLLYAANYASGLRILDITNPLEPKEVGFFDTQPVGENVPAFTGAWSNYPFFPSGVIAVSSIEQGLFLLRYRPTRPVS
jgi:choice-of-anchor B domain-containing protein